MERSFREQLQRFIDSNGVKVLAALGISKAVEVLILVWFPGWFSRVVVFLGLSLGVLWVAAWSDSIDL